MRTFLIERERIEWPGGRVEQALFRGEKRMQGKSGTLFRMGQGRFDLFSEIWMASAASL